MHVSRLSVFRNSTIDEAVIRSHVLQLETGMVVSRLLGIEVTPDGLLVRVLGKGLKKSEDTFESIACVHEDFPGLFQKMLLRKSIPPGLAAGVSAELGLQKRGV